MDIVFTSETRVRHVYLTQDQFDHIVQLIVPEYILQRADMAKTK